MKLRFQLLLVFSMIFVVCPGYAQQDSCTTSGIGSICYFNSFNHEQLRSIYFHCDSNEVIPFVKLTNHGVLISGFIPGAGPGAGTLTLAGLDVNQILKTYYFEVKGDPGHLGSKYVWVAASGHLVCRLGRGDRSMLFPGDFG